LFNLYIQESQPENKQERSKKKFFFGWGGGKTLKNTTISKNSTQIKSLESGLTLLPQIFANRGKGSSNAEPKNAEFLDYKLLTCVVILSCFSIDYLQTFSSSSFEFNVVLCSVSVLPLQHRCCSVCMSFVKLGRHNG